MSLEQFHSQLGAAIDASRHRENSSFFVVIVPTPPEVPRVEECNSYEEVASKLVEHVGTDAYTFIFEGMRLHVRSGMPLKLCTPAGDIPLVAAGDDGEIITTGSLRGRPELQDIGVREEADDETREVVGVAGEGEDENAGSGIL